MTNPDVVFAKFVAANPVTDPATVPAQLPPADEVLGSVRGRRGHQRVDRRQGRPGRGWAVALASFILVVSLGVSINWLRGEAESDVGVDSLEVVQRQALSTTERWLDAVNQGDIEEVMALSSPDSSQIADRRVYEWLAGFAERGMPTLVSACQTIEVSVGGATVECSVLLTDPVAVEAGVSELIAPFLYEDGMVAWQPYRGGDISQVNAAYSDYLSQFHQADYESVCAPGAYPSGSVVEDRGLALTGECAELAAPLAGEVAQWMRDGRPVPEG